MVAPVMFSQLKLSTNSWEMHESHFISYTQEIDGPLNRPFPAINNFDWGDSKANLKDLKLLSAKQWSFNQTKPWRPPFMYWSSNHLRHKAKSKLQNSGQNIDIDWWWLHRRTMFLLYLLACLVELAQATSALSSSAAALAGRELPTISSSFLNQGQWLTDRPPLVIRCLSSLYRFFRLSTLFLHCSTLFVCLSHLSLTVAATSSQSLPLKFPRFSCINFSVYASRRHSIAASLHSSRSFRYSPPPDDATADPAPALAAFFLRL